MYRAFAFFDEGLLYRWSTESEILSVIGRSQIDSFYCWHHNAFPSFASRDVAIHVQKCCMVVSLVWSQRKVRSARQPSRSLFNAFFLAVKLFSRALVGSSDPTHGLDQSQRAHENDGLSPVDSSSPTVEQTNHRSFHHVA